MKYFCLMMALFIFSAARSQQKLILSAKNSCSYIEAKSTDDLYQFKSSQEALDVVKKITDIVGLAPNFVLIACNVPNAKAVIDNNRRLILYSESFINSLNLETKTDWSGVSILAHEIGHHLNGHTLDDNATRPELELDADKFSGFVLRKLGASLSEAQISVNTLCPNDGTVMYPPKSARLEAIAAGWKNAVIKDESMSESMKFFTSGLPKKLYPSYKPLSGQTYSLNGELDVNYRDGKIVVKGNLQLQTTDKYHFSISLKGSFEGEYVLSPRQLLINFDNGDLYLVIPISGKVDYIQFGEERPKSFDTIAIYIKGVNSIKAYLNDNISSTDSLDLYKNNLDSIIFK